jgi:hypothetical protein
VNLHFSDGDARRLGWSLSLVCEWLRRADEPILDDLADFGFGLRLQPREHLQRLIGELEVHAAVLGQRPPATSSAPGAA